MTFSEYLSDALTYAVANADNGEDGGELQGIVDRCRMGVRSSWNDLTPDRLMFQLLWCIGSAAKKYDIRTEEDENGSSYWTMQLALFRQANPGAIYQDRLAIRREWSEQKCYLSPKMVDALLQIAGLIVEMEWPGFKGKYLLLPEDPETTRTGDWRRAVKALDVLPGVGVATAWYLPRNLYGAPVFKPDVHILAIAEHFFPGSQRLDLLTQAVQRTYPEICDRLGVGERVFCPHLGVVDYILWWYRSRGHGPAAPKSTPRIGTC